MSLNVRPNKIFQAANWLATNSTLYREQGISFSTDRATSYNTNLSQNESKTGDVSQTNEQISGSEDINQLDDWTEDDAEIPVGVTDTMLWNWVTDTMGKSQIALRKCKANNRNLTTGHLKQEGALERLVHLDEGYKFLRALRGSPPYFERAKKDIFAMIRQLGPATLFCSFSSDETKWIHLLRILGKLVDAKEYSDSELENLNWEEKSRLIQGEPVTCARHFDYQFNQFLRYFLMSNAAPLGKVAD